ncbi:hypothetical protein [Breoghania sp.]|uniref:hypothetical protein n=1 Tax=Breoghania sp. TaxID=2065378 RepID=UPI002616173E|nr:hypothetical protein [Breoghania sp.]MDJ0932246.1 hypothetical protein [Breoghania sp.]
MLEVGLDKEHYRADETAKLRLEPHFSGTALIAVMVDGLIYTKVVQVEGGHETSVDLPVTEAWGPGAYVIATLYRPMDIAAKRMPSRAIGLTWLDVDPGNRDISVELSPHDMMRPNGTLSVPVRLANVTAGEEAM